MAAEKTKPLKIMISGAPASGKGTQCELITQKVSFLVLFWDTNLMNPIHFMIILSMNLNLGQP